MRATYQALKPKIHKVVKMVKESRKNQYIVISSAILFIVFIFLIRLNNRYNEVLELLKNESKISEERLSQLTEKSDKIVELEETIGQLDERNQYLEAQHINFKVQDFKLLQEKKDLSKMVDKYSSTIDYYKIHFDPYWVLIRDMDESFLDIDGPLWVDEKMDKELVKMLQKHIKARYSKDEKAFMETMISGGPNSGYQIYYMADEEYYHAEVRIILSSYESVPNSSGLFAVCVVSQKEKDDTPEAEWYYAYAKKLPSGKWYLTVYS